MQAKAERQRVIAEMPAETRAAMENMRFFKFYPTPSDDTPDIEQYKVSSLVHTRKRGTVHRGRPLAGQFLKPFRGDSLTRRGTFLDG